MQFRFESSIAALALSTSFLLPFNSAAQANDRQVTIVSHIDIKPDAYMPLAEEKAATIFRAEAAATKRDPGLLSYVILQETGGANHFTIVESWQNLKAYEQRVGAGHTVQFRTDIQPFLGSPFDSRVHQIFR